MLTLNTHIQHKIDLSHFLHLYASYDVGYTCCGVFIAFPREIGNNNFNEQGCLG